MKIVINAVSAKMGGAVTYLTNVLCCLPSSKSSFEFVVFLPPETAEKQKNLASNIDLVPTSIGHAKWWKRLWWEQVTLRRQLKKCHADALFSTANFGMFWCPVRQILLVRIQLYFSRIFLDTFLPKHRFKSRLSFRLRRWLCCQSARTADVVMTPTQAMLDDLRQFVEVGPAKALVNHYGVVLPNGNHVKPTGSPADTSAQVVRLLYVSLYAEHKNLNTLLKAMALLNQNVGGRFTLITTADPNWMNWAVTYKDDWALARTPEVAECVQFVAPLDRRQTHELYEKSDIFVFPSLAESFGHPMVEAMAHSLPIVAADTPVNREICCDAAIYFEPFAPEDLARKVKRLALDCSLREDLTAAAGGQVSRFQWATHVERVVGTLQGRPPEPETINDSKAFPPSDRLDRRTALT